MDSLEDSSMMPSLKILQHYRNTILLISGLFGIAIIAGIISLISYSRNSALDPNIPNATNNPNELQVDWSKVKLGQSQEEIVKQFGNPKKTTQSELGTLLTYDANSKQRLGTHEIIIKDNKAISIKRSINSNTDTLNISQYANKYKNSELVRPQSGLEIPAMVGYKVSNNEYLIVEVDQQNNQVYNVYDMTKDAYDVLKKQFADTTQPGGDQGFEAF